MSSGGVRLRRGGGTRGKNPPWKNRPRSLPPPREGGGGRRREGGGTDLTGSPVVPPSAAAAAAAAAAGSALHRGHDRSGPAAAAWPGGGLLARVVYSVTGLQP